MSRWSPRNKFNSTTSSRSTVLARNVNRHMQLCWKLWSLHIYPVKLLPEPIISRDVPERPWQRVGSDIMSFNGRMYLITTDSHSSFFEVDQLTDLSAETVIKKLKKNFARHGIPEELVTDCGTQFTAELFKKFANKWEFHHAMSSPEIIEQMEQLKLQ